MTRRFAAVFVLFAFFPCLASEPGQPLDCSDWVFLEPGLSCTMLVTPPVLCSEWCHRSILSF